MPERIRDRIRLRARASTGPAAKAALLSAVLIAAAAAIWFAPYLTGASAPITSVAGRPANFALAEFPLLPRQDACMQQVTVTANSRLAQFVVRPAATALRGGAPLEVVLTGPGYESRSHVPGGYAGGPLVLPITPPVKNELATACFVNRGRATAILIGSAEPQALTRSSLVVAGKPQDGEITLAFLDSGRHSLIDRAGEVLGHISNLTDRLVPLWLIWIIAVLVALGVPTCTVAALYAAMREDLGAGPR